MYKHFWLFRYIIIGIYGLIVVLYTLIEVLYSGIIIFLVSLFVDFNFLGRFKKVWKEVHNNKEEYELEMSCGNNNYSYYCDENPIQTIKRRCGLINNK